MKTVMEKVIVASGNTSDVFHKVFLVKELKSKGFEKAIAFKTENDIHFIESIRYEEPKKILKELEEYLYTL